MRGLALRVGAVLIGVIGALIVAEIAVRIFLPAPESARVASDTGFRDRLSQENSNPSDMRLNRGVEDGGVLYFQTPSGMRLRANTHAVIENHHVGGRTIDLRTNSLGYRNRELGPKDPNQKRVLFLGDSITIQDYLPEEETMVRLVETKSKATDEPLETVNSGVGAIGLATELAILMETGLATDPDVVVLNWYLNDVQGSEGVETLRPTGLLAHSRLAELLFASIAGLEPERIREDQSMIPMDVDAQWRAEVAKKFPPKQGDAAFDRQAFNYRIQALFFDWGSAWSDGAWERMKPMIAEIKRQADLHGFKFLIVAFPNVDQIQAGYVHDYPQQKLKEVAGELGVPVLDLLPFLRERMPKETEVMYWDWCHPSPHGSDVISEEILKFVQKES
ncbi:MAG: hypothetical protein FJ144_25900 [Deltaproteobacteria bacterium]|nr:hypothetical protein [Deltaproteobacteria bacterium]